MEMLNAFDMRLRRFILCFFGFSIIVIIWKLSVIETDVEKLQFLKETLFMNKEQLQLSQHQLLLVEHLYQNKVGKTLPTIYAITPTYARYVQKAELTRISQTLALVPNIHWIVVEDAEEKSVLVQNLLNDSNIMYTHLMAKTPPFEKLTNKNSRWTKHRGVEQRNAGLKWLRDALIINDHRGVVYFMDDDNTYSVKLFDEISKVRRVGVWPVGLVGGLNVEAPMLDKKTGKVVGYKSGWKSNRPFAIDMAGFAIDLDLILKTKEAVFAYTMGHGLQESEFLSYFTTMDELEPLATDCTKVYVWHTRTEVPKISGVVKDFEV